jgi:hypothetical protein
VVVLAAGVGLARVGAGVDVAPGVRVAAARGVGVAPPGVSSEQASSNSVAGIRRRRRFIRNLDMRAVSFVIPY